jgi:predicted MPP superfamily phosphohydrolase
LKKFLKGAVGLGAIAAAYPFIERQRYHLGRKAVPVPSTAPALTVLHLSDTHLTARDRKLARFVASLPDEVGTPDLVLATGDMIEDDGGIDPLLEALEGVRGRLGRFYVLGSHDYYQAQVKPPTRYFTSNRGPSGAQPADVGRLEEGLGSQGWRSLVNRTEMVEAEGLGTIRLAGVDDPYLGRQRTGHIERGNGEVLAIGLTHAPDVVSPWLLHGYDLVLAGHTHGGQLRLPFVGAIVTNSSLPSALAAGLHKVGGGVLHVSMGLGTSKYAPVRFLARPEATLLELVPEQATGPTGRSL